MTSEVEVTKADSPRAVAFRTVDDAPVTASGEWQISPDGGGSGVVCDVAIEAHGFVRLFEPFKGPSLKRTAQRYEAALEERLGA